uniref:Uncharacterized protein n=1 Tax=Nothobranchius furzeri TaxID=105023 RepID=A0A8C6PCF6_NOTFU
MVFLLIIASLHFWETLPSVAPLIFEKEGVYLHTNAKRSNQETSIPGFIRVVERAGVPALEWSPLEDEGHSAPAVLYSRKVQQLIVWHMPKI